MYLYDIRKWLYITCLESVPHLTFSTSFYGLITGKQVNTPTWSRLFSFVHVKMAKIDKQAIRDAYEEVRNDSSDTNW